MFLVLLVPHGVFRFWSVNMKPLLQLPLISRRLDLAWLPWRPRHMTGGVGVPVTKQTATVCLSELNRVQRHQRGTRSTSHLTSQFPWRPAAETKAARNGSFKIIWRNDSN